MIRRFIFSLAISLIASEVFAESITGAGASFPYPIYSKWAGQYSKDTGNQINYQSIGSGGGIKQIQSGTIDFAGSDKPLSKEDLEKFKLLQFPSVIGGVVVIYNLPEVEKQLKLRSEVLADIYLKKITKWNDPRIVEDNPEISLPDRSIIVVHRSDGSGTTFMWTNFLSKVSNDWANKVGFASSVKWITGTGAKGNEGMANLVSRTKGSIGYVEYSYARENQIQYASISNANDKFVNPSPETFASAASSADWDYDKNAFGEILTNIQGDDSYPISAATFVLIYAKAKDDEKTKTIIDFYDWAFNKGQAYASELGYVPLPQDIVDKVKNMWKENIKNSNREPLRF